MRPASRPSLLNITNGESAGNTLRQTTLGGAVLPWQDVLHEGPVPALPRQQLLRTHSRFLADCGWGSEQALLSSLERRDRQLLEALRDDLPVVLWFEHDLYDQLQLLDVARASRARRSAATPAVLEAAEAAWASVQGPEPTALAESASRDTAELPFLAAALRRMLEELPAPGDGLSGTERRALEAVAAGARTPPAAFVAAQRLEDAPFLGDSWFYRALSALGQGKERLLETGEGSPVPPPPPLGNSQDFARLELRLTASGERTLRGEADRVELLGIDRWIGGTHITPDDTWRWNDAERKLVRL